MKIYPVTARYPLPLSHTKVSDIPPDSPCHRKNPTHHMDPRGVKLLAHLYDVQESTITALDSYFHSVFIGLDNGTVQKLEVVVGEADSIHTRPLLSVAVSTSTRRHKIKKLAHSDAEPLLFVLCNRRVSMFDSATLTKLRDIDSDVATFALSTLATSLPAFGTPLPSIGSKGSAAAPSSGKGTTVTAADGNAPAVEPSSTSSRSMLAAVTSSANFLKSSMTNAAQAELNATGTTTSTARPANPTAGGGGGRTTALPNPTIVAVHRITCCHKDTRDVLVHEYRSDVNELREGGHYLLPEVVEVAAEHNGLLCVGMSREYSLINLSNGDSRSLLALNGRSPNLAYHAGEGNVYLIWRNALFVVPLSKLPATSLDAISRTIPLEHEPRAVTVRYGLVFAFSAQRCEVFNSYEGEVVQQLPVADCCFVSDKVTEDDIVFCASRKQLWFMQSYTLQARLHDLVARFKIEPAFDLLRKHDQQTPALEHETKVAVAYAFLRRPMRSFNAVAMFNALVDVREVLRYAPGLIPLMPPHYGRRVPSLADWWSSVSPLMAWGPPPPVPVGGVTAASVPLTNDESTKTVPPQQPLPVGRGGCWWPKQIADAMQDILAAVSDSTRAVLLDDAVVNSTKAGAASSGAEGGTIIGDEAPAAPPPSTVGSEGAGSSRPSNQQSTAVAMSRLAFWLRYTRHSVFDPKIYSLQEEWSRRLSRKSRQSGSQAAPSSSTAAATADSGAQKKPGGSRAAAALGHGQHHPLSGATTTRSASYDDVGEAIEDSPQSPLSPGTEGRGEGTFGDDPFHPAAGPVTVARCWDDLRIHLLPWLRARQDAREDLADGEARAIAYALLALTLEMNDHPTFFAVLTSSVDSLELCDCLPLLVQYRQWRALYFLASQKGPAMSDLAETVWTQRIRIQVGSLHGRPQCRPQSSSSSSSLPPPPPVLPSPLFVPLGLRRTTTDDDALNETSAHATNKEQPSASCAEIFFAVEGQLPNHVADVVKRCPEVLTTTVDKDHNTPLHVAVARCVVAAAAPSATSGQMITDDFRTALCIVGFIVSRCRGRLTAVRDGVHHVTPAELALRLVRTRTFRAREAALVAGAIFACDNQAVESAMSGWVISA